MTDGAGAPALLERMNMIKPSIGRVVHYRPTGISGVICAALITAVHSDTCINLRVFHADGTDSAPASVDLVQDNNYPSDGRAFAEWMPYQIGQAAKTEQVIADAAAATESAPAGVTLDVADTAPAADAETTAADAAA